tara:strand:+ start:138 stop:539 length:402 start_codon:yes stop_codon:yes gene_type:complete
MGKYSKSKIHKQEIYITSKTDDNKLLKSKLSNLSEEEFLVNYRRLITYEERVDALTNRGYIHMDEELKDIEKNFYITENINIKSEMERWVKRKPFNVIKKELLSNPNIVSENPYSEFTVFDDNGKPHTFYKKN